MMFRQAVRQKSMRTVCPPACAPVPSATATPRRWTPA